MKLNAENKRTLNAIGKALLLGVPISGMLIAAGVDAADKKSANTDDSAPQKDAAKKTVTIDQMSLSYRFGTTPGVIYPPMLVVYLQEYIVKANDTWESLAKRYKTTVEIMLRINRDGKETARKKLSGKNVPENQKLIPGQEIYVPGKITYSHGTPGGKDNE